jgi:hypothetical protein
VALVLTCFAGPAIGVARAQSPPAAAPRAIDLVGTAQWDRYFPFRLGDSWTYDWRAEGPAALGGTPVRTRTFDGTSFIGDTVGYKLVSDDGAFHLYTYEQRTLAVHSSSEAGRLSYYDPPIVVAAPDMRVGEARTIAQSEGGRTWKSTVLGLESIDVPLGHFDAVLVVRLEMTGADGASVATQYFARDAGLVALRYQLRDAPGGRVLLEVTASLRLARLAGVNVARLEDLARVATAATATPTEDRDLRETVRRALARRYTWDATFPGFKGEAQLTQPGQSPVRARFVVGRDLSVRVEASDAAAKAALTNEISSFVTMRKDVPFDVTYAETTFVKDAPRADGAVVVTAAGDPLATSYAIRDGRIVEVSRSLGRVSYLARDRATLSTEDGRDLSVEYDVVYRSTADGADLAVERTRDSYAKVGRYWLPSGRRVDRSAAGQPGGTMELTLANLSVP